MLKSNRRPRTCSPRRNPNRRRRRGGSSRSPSYHLRSQSLSPQRAGKAQHVPGLSLDSASPGPASTSQPVSAHHTAVSHKQPADGSEEQQLNFYTSLLLSDVNGCWKLVHANKNRHKSDINITQSLSLCHLAICVGNNMLQCVAPVSTPMEIFLPCVC